MLKDELDILNVFRREIFLMDSIRGIMKKAGSKSYGRIFTSTQSLINEGVLISQKQGKSTVCSINLEHPKTIAYFSFLDHLEFSSIFKGENLSALKILIKSLPIKHYSLLISGSNVRSKGKEKELDFILLVDDSIDSTRILNILTNSVRLSSPFIHPYVFRTREFLDMLLIKENNFAKEIFANHLIFSGSEQYYSLIQEAIEHGFKH